MKKGQKFLLSFGAAAITFGSLYAAMGPRQFGRHHFQNGWHQNIHHGHCRMDNDQDLKSSQLPKDQPVK